jgi:hypothetical protein
VIKVLLYLALANHVNSALLTSKKIERAKKSFPPVTDTHKAIAIPVQKAQLVRAPPFREFFFLRCGIQYSKPPHPCTAAAKLLLIA